jgi:outer membrane protein OmpA-like peptidoglycan-associated protein
VEVLPSEVKPEEAAPILDSVKEQQTAPAQPVDQGQPSSQPASSSEAPPPATPPAPPPKTDQQAQADIAKPTPEQQSTQTDKGKKSKVQDIQIAPPQGNGDVQVKVIQAPPAPTPPPPQNNGSSNPPPAPPPQQNNTAVIFQIGVNIVIRNPEQERDRYYDPREDEIYYEDLGRGRTRETVTRPNGTKIVTIRSRHGDVLQRSKILPNGREILLSTYDPKDSDLDSWRDPGDDLPPLHLTIPASDYILDSRSADDEEVTDFLDQPPVERVRRIYTIDEVKRSARLRDSVRRLEVGGLTFDTGKATIARSQVGALSKVADAMQKLLDRNPGEVFLIEGHTDAVGSDISNLVLSDQRAATVARILTDFYDIPPENLVTQGYGERYLRVKTEAAEPLNRRVTIKRITPLVTYTAQR